MRRGMCAGFLLAMFVCGSAFCERREVSVEDAKLMLGDSIIGTLKKGMVVEVLTEQGEWCSVKIEGEGFSVKGWVKNGELKVLAQPEQLAPKTAPETVPEGKDAGKPAQPAGPSAAELHEQTKEALERIVRDATESHLSFCSKFYQEEKSQYRGVEALRHVECRDILNCQFGLSDSDFMNVWNVAVERYWNAEATRISNSMIKLLRQEKNVLDEMNRKISDMKSGAVCADYKPVMERFRRAIDARVHLVDAGVEEYGRLLEKMPDRGRRIGIRGYSVGADVMKKTREYEDALRMALRNKEICDAGCKAQGM